MAAFQEDGLASAKKARLSQVAGDDFTASAARLRKAEGAKPKESQNSGASPATGRKRHRRTLIKVNKLADAPQEERRPFEVVDGIYKQDIAMSKQKAVFEHSDLVSKLNATVGKYQSPNMKILWSEEDPVLYEIALKRLAHIEDKVQQEYKRNQVDERHAKVLQLDNQALLTDEATMQKEILKGHFRLRISNKMQTPHRIEKYAQEPVAYFLHKKRDFLQRLLSSNHVFEERDLLEYQNILKYIAGETAEGRQRQLWLQRKREQQRLKYGFQQTEVRRDCGYFKRRATNNSLQESRVEDGEPQIFDLEGLIVQKSRTTVGQQENEGGSTFVRSPKPELQRQQSFSKAQVQQVVPPPVPRAKTELRGPKKEVPLNEEEQGKLLHRAIDQIGNEIQEDIKLKSIRLQYQKQKMAERMLQARAKHDSSMRSVTGLTRNSGIQRGSKSVDRRVMEHASMDMSRTSSFLALSQKYNDNVLFNRIRDQTSTSNPFQKTFFFTQPYQADSEAQDAYGGARPAVRKQSVLGAMPEIARRGGSTHRKIDSIMRGCQHSSNATQLNLNKLKADLQSQSQLNSDFDGLVETFKGLEGIEFKVLETMYHYRKLDQLERQEESRGVCQEYKSGVMDPSRYVAKMERSTLKKR